MTNQKSFLSILKNISFVKKLLPKQANIKFFTFKKKQNFLLKNVEYAFTYLLKGTKFLIKLLYSVIKSKPKTTENNTILT